MKRRHSIPIRFIACLVIVTLALGAGTVASAASEEGLGIAKKHTCIACHGVDKKIIGPAFQAIAQKYKGDKEAAAKIEQSIRKGSQGKWGAIAMPPNATLKDSDLHSLSGWILSR